MKKIVWVGSSLKDLSEMPARVKKEMGFALFEAQMGGLSLHAKPFKGAGTGVMRSL